MKPISYEPEQYIKNAYHIKYQVHKPSSVVVTIVVDVAVVVGASVVDRETATSKVSFP